MNYLAPVFLRLAEHEMIINYQMALLTQFPSASTPTPTPFGSCTASTGGTWITSGTFVVSATVGPIASTPGAEISEQKILAKNQLNCPPVRQGISAACSCFYGPATTRTVSATATVTSYIAGQATHEFAGRPLLRTVAGMASRL